MNKLIDKFPEMDEGLKRLLIETDLSIVAYKEQAKELLSQILHSLGLAIKYRGGKEQSTKRSRNNYSRFFNSNPRKV